MVEQHVAFGQHLEQVGPGRQPGRDEGGPGLRLEVGSVQAGQLAQPAEIDRHVEEIDAVLGDADLGDEHLEQLGGDAGGHLEADRLTEPPAVQLELDGGREVLRVVLVDGEVGVAGHPEDVVLGDGHRREEALQVGGDDLLDRHQPVPVGQGDEAGQEGRHLDPGDPLLAGRRVDHPHAPD